MFCMMHINVYVFFVYEPLIKKLCNDFVGFYFFLYKISSTRILCSSLSSFICGANFSYGTHSSTC